MTPERRAAETRRKRAERQRRREAGYKRVECWLSKDVIAGMDAYCEHHGDDREGFISSAVWWWLKENPPLRVKIADEDQSQ